MRDQRAYVLHIRDALDRILSYTEGGREDFVQDPMIQDAVLPNMEILGEAAKRVSGEVRDLGPGIPWREMAGMRDKLIHDYFGVDLTLVWDVVEKELPGAREQIERLLAELSSR